jgi:L-lactate permease
MTMLQWQQMYDPMGNIWISSLIASSNISNIFLLASNFVPSIFGTVVVYSVAGATGGVTTNV